MKKSIILLAALTMTLLVFSLKRETPTSAVEKTDITVLIETAKTPEDQLKIAEYYEDQAVMMEKRVTLHEAMAEAYKGTKFTGMTSHCEKLAKEFKESADQYKAMAEEHRKMAQEMRSQNSPKPQ